MARQNYNQVKRQKEAARKARQLEKQQKRTTRVEAPADGTDGAPAPEGATTASLPQAESVGK